MRVPFRLALLLPLAALLGCTVPSAPTNPAQPSSSWQNWQIQAGSTITSPPTTYPNFVGASQVLGSQANGVFTSVSSNTASPEVLSYGGKYDAATGMVTLATFGWGFGYTEPASPYAPVPVDVIGGCVYPPTYTGPECLALIAINPAVGVQIAPLNGTYVGTLTAANAPGLSGIATLTLTQAPAPNSSGQFPLSGTIAFPASSNLAPVPLAGTVAGEAITLSDPSAAPNSPSIDFTAAANPAATQIAVSNLAYSGSGTSATFTGTLTRQ